MADLSGFTDDVGDGLDASGEEDVSLLDAGVPDVELSRALFAALPVVGDCRC
ncbi:MAG: hypothetical protein U0872_01045 [Planctomycetaceae bacterium]